MDNTDKKPDFEEISERWSEGSCIYRQHLKEHYAKAFEAGLHRSWREYVTPLQSRISELEKQHNHLRAIALDFEKERNAFLNQRNEYMTRLNRANEFLDINGMGVKF